MIDYIEKFAEDEDYYQILFTIVSKLPDDDWEALRKIIDEAEKTNRKLYIDETDYEDVLWDGITIDMVKISEQ